LSYWSANFAFVTYHDSCSQLLRFFVKRMFAAMPAILLNLKLCLLFLFITRGRIVAAIALRTR